ncbi:hypothetical protein LCGC14_1128440 [marine sediment metagenome]|uniref:Rhodanese domain-containing protein n=1 Tax=marine sediment metagenome TaxID=412755 RepID=A0A0F9MPN0_9ZZZZ
MKYMKKFNSISFKIIIIIGFIFFTSTFLKSVSFVKAQSYTDISVQEAYNMIQDDSLYPNLVILDVREQYEYDENHLYNATLIPRLEIDDRISELLPYNDTEIIVYCRTGGRSAMASQNLDENHHFTKIYNMLGGINAWIDAGFPVWTPDDGANGANGTNGQSIGFTSNIFFIIMIGTISIIILHYRKSRIKIN